MLKHQLTGSGYPDDNPKTAVGSKKPSLTKFPASALIYGSLAMMNGAAKYGPYNWREKRVTASIYVDAAKRHLDAWFDGETNSSDTNPPVPHLGHALASIAILVDALETGNLNDDRPRPGPAGRMLEQWAKLIEEARAIQMAPSGAEAKFIEHVKARGGFKTKSKRGKTRVKPHIKTLLEKSPHIKRAAKGKRK